MGPRTWKIEKVIRSSDQECKMGASSPEYRITSLHLRRITLSIFKEVTLPFFQPIFDPFFEAEDRRWEGSSIFGSEDRRWEGVLRSSAPKNE